MQEVVERAYSEFLADFRDKASELLQDFTAQPRQAAERLIEFIKKDWAGQQVYFPKNAAYELASRDWQIYNEFNGQNLHEISKKYGLTAARIYQIDAACRKIKSAKEQPQLFEGGD